MITRLLALVGVVSFVTIAPAAPAKPNIILIYTDDHGYADLDGLARSGVVAKTGYSTDPQCVPSTGDGSPRARSGKENGNLYDEWSSDEITLPAERNVIHLRIHLPGKSPKLRNISLKS